MAKKFKIMQQSKQRAFILLPVVFTLTIMASVAYLLSRDSAINAGNVNREQQYDAAMYIAKAGYERAIWNIQQNCTAYADIPLTAFGDNSYQASYTDATPAGENLQVSIEAMGALANGASYTISRDRVQIYQFPTQTLTIQPAAEDAKDAYIWKSHKTTNYGNDNGSLVATGSNTALALFQFELSNMPQGAKIFQAILSVHHRNGNVLDVPITAHRIRSSWDEAFVTWNKRDNDDLWDTAGGDFDSIITSTTLVGSTASVRYEWDITSLVQGWTKVSDSNNGVVLRTVKPSTYGERFDTSDHTDPTRRPKLTIIYACECGASCELIDPLLPVKKEDVSLPITCGGTFRDEFNSIAYNNNDGTLNWDTDWQEVNETDGPTKGDELVKVDLSTMTNQLRVQDNDGGGEGVMRTVNLTGANSASLTFEYRREQLNTTSDYVSVQVSSAATSGLWIELDKLSGVATDSGYSVKKYDISAYIASDTTIRFMSSADMERTSAVWFDNVEIQCVPKELAVSS